MWDPDFTYVLFGGLVPRYERLWLDNASYLRWLTGYYGRIING